MPGFTDLDFGEDRPVVDLDLQAAPDPRLILHRLPLADAVLNILSQVLSPAGLDRIFHKNRGRSFEHVLSFSTFVSLIRDALLQHHGSGRQSFQRAKEQGTFETSIEAVYAKLRRIPMPLSLGFLESASRDLQTLFPDRISAWEVPPSLRDFHVVILDGKTIKKVAKRLKATRTAQGKISGGKLLVALTPQSGLVLTMAADLDGEASEARLVPQLLERVDLLLPQRRLWIADALFGVPAQIARFLQKDGDHVLLRWDSKTEFTPDCDRPAVKGRDSKGREIIQEWGYYGAISNKHRRYMRQITLVRPGEDDVVLVTDLLDEKMYPAEDLLASYLGRWNIERVFQQVTEVFALNHLIGTTAQATIFQASFCFVLYNMIQVIRGHIASMQKDVESADDLSSEQIFNDVRRQLIATYELVDVPELTKSISTEWDSKDLFQWQQSRLSGVWTSRWKKAKNKKPRPKKPEVGSCYGAHNSVHRLCNPETKDATKPP